MNGVNKVILVATLGRDPEVRYTPSGAAVANVSVATSYVRKDKQTGEKIEQTEWHRLVFFNRLAEIAGEYLKKGSPVYVEGRLQTRKWEKDNITRYSTEVIVEEMQMLGSKGDRGASAPASAEKPAKGAHTASGGASGGGGYDDFDDDIPF